MEIDRRLFFAGLGGAAAVSLMSDEAKADALEDYMSSTLDDLIEQQTGAEPAKKFPTAAEIEAQIETRPSRRGCGNLFLGRGGNVKRLTPMPEQPTFLDFFNNRFSGTANHCLQSANHAMKTGMTDEIVFACLIHDLVHALIKVDHDYRPDKYIDDTYKMVRRHKLYILPRQVTVHDLYAFEPGVKVTIEPFVDIIGRQFRQPKEGLGYDNSAVAHMWRSMIKPDSPL
jgi:hypothetical protein